MVTSRRTQRESYIGNYTPSQDRKTPISTSPTPFAVTKPVTNQTFNEDYPWLNEKSYRKMEWEIDKLKLSWQKRVEAMNNWYRNNVTYLLNDQTLDERDTYLNQQAYQAANLQSPEAYAQLRMSEASQKAKKLWNLDATANDLDVFSDIVDSLPNWIQLAWEYLEWKNKDLLYEAWILDRIEAPETPESTVWGIQSIINKQSEMWTDTTAWKVNAVADWLNFPWKVTEFVDWLVQKIPVVTWETQVKNLVNKMNNLSDEEIQNLYGRYVNMIRNGSDEKRKNDDRNGYALFWDAITWDKDALDRINTLHLINYDEALGKQDWIQRNKRWNQALENVTGTKDIDAVYENIDNSNMNSVAKWLAKASVWTTDKMKNLVNFAGWLYWTLENYADALGVGLQQLDDIKDMRYAPTEWLETNEDAFMEFVADKTANFWEYMLDAPDTVMWKPVTPNALKFVSNIPWSFIKTLSAQVRWKTNPVDTKVWLAKLLFTEEWQEALLNRYGTPEALANAMNTDPVWVADDMLDLADKVNLLLNKTTWWTVERQQIWSLMDWLSDNAVRNLWAWMTKVSDWMENNWYKRTSNLINLERDVSMNPSQVVDDTKKIAQQWAEDVVNASKYVYDEAWNIIGTIKDGAVTLKENIAQWASNLKEWLGNLKNSAVESIAERVSWNKTAQDKLFQAQEPTLNRLSKERNTKNIRNKAEVANELIVKDIKENWWQLPTDTQTRVDAHERAMRNKWKEIEKKLWDRWGVTISTKQLADDLDKYIQDIEKLKISKNKSDLEALKEQSKDLRAMWQVDLLTLEKQKEMINANLNDWDDKSIGNVYKNWMTELTRKMWQIEDDIIARIPWEFQDLKNDFGALADGYGDVIKANVKAQRAKYQDSISNYSRIKWIWDILKWVYHLDLWEIGKWTAQMVWWEVTAKLKDKDWLIEEWFKNLAADMDKPDFKSAKNNLAWRPTNEANTSSKVQAQNDKTVKNLLKAWKKKK